MALTVQFWSRCEVKDNQGVVHTLGRDPLKDLPVTISAATEAVHLQTHSVADSASAKIFDVDDDLADFDFMFIIPEAAGLLEFITDDDGDNGELYLAFQTVANFPFAIPGDGSLAGDGTAGSFDGTADVVETVRWYNNSGATALVHVFAVT